MEKNSRFQVNANTREFIINLPPDMYEKTFYDVKKFSCIWCMVFCRKMPKLNEVQMAELSSALEMTAFSRTHSKRMAGVPKSHNQAPNQKPLSQSVGFFADMMLDALELARSTGRRHLVRLSRNLVTSISTAIAKLEQDKKKLEPCAKCTYDKEINKNDLMELMVLSQFILHDLSKIQESEMDIKSIFVKFYTGNEAIVKQMLSRRRK